MWFKNLQIYRLPSPWAVTQAKLNADLASGAFTPTGSMEMQSMGWVAPVEHGDLVHAVNGQFLLKLCIEKKLLPTSVINEAAALRATEIEDQQGFKPGRKQMKEIKESITDELLPRAFSVKSYTSVWIDPINGWMGIDTGSPGRSDDVMKRLLVGVDTFPIQSLHTMQSPITAMTNWLDLDIAPFGFTVDQDTELRANAEGKATVTYKHYTADAKDLQRHIAEGKQCTKLALTWNDRMSFVLTESLAIKRITPLDVIQETATAMENEHDRFDVDFLLMAADFGEMLACLVDSLGGEQAAGQVDIVTEQATSQEGAPASHTGDGPDPLHDTAVGIVRTHKRASISLVQRHLRIGYNRAARLLEQMELSNVVSVMQSNGTREILHAG